MNWNVSKFILLFLVGVEISVNSRINADAGEDSWMDPDAWARDISLDSLDTKMGECCKCPDENIVLDVNTQEPKEKNQISPEDAASLIYLKKFLTMLFNRKHFKYDSTLQQYERSIVFSVHSTQMEKLEQLQDPRDLDIILVEIFNNVRTPNMYSDGHMYHSTESSSSGFKQIIFDLFYDMWQLTRTSEIKFLLVVILVALIVWILHIRTNVSWWTLLFGGALFYGYLHTYLECNRELEVNQMLEVINNDKGNEMDSKFLKFIKGIFSSDEKVDLHEKKLKQSAKLTLGFCRPDHVLIMYFNDIFLKYLQVLLEQFTTTLTKLNSDLGFPYNILSGFLLVILIGYILKLVFKYLLSPGAWVQLINRKNIDYVPQQAAIKNSANSNDCISGDNLKLLLNAINATPQRKEISVNLPIAAAVSGVEEVKEALEAPPTNKSPQKETNISKMKQNINNNSNDNPLNEITDVTLEDLPDDS